MEALAEQLVATYLTRGGKVFVVPQYPIPGDDDDIEWAWPDFVALNFENRERFEVLVVEITTVSDPRNFIQKVQKHKAQWFERVMGKLKKDGIVDDRWSIRFVGFVRKQNIQRLKMSFRGVNDVAFIAIEDATFSWDYWEARKGGLA